MTGDDSRGRGILSPADRQYLRNPEEYSRQASHEREKAIRGRVDNAIRDFTVLFEHLDHDQREKIFGSNLTPQIQFNDSAFESGVRDGLAFLIEGSGGSGLLEEHSPSEATAERMLEEAFEQIAWRYRYELLAVQLEVTAEKIPWRDLQTRLLEGEELTSQEFGQLLSALGDTADTTEVQEDLRSQLLDMDHIDRDVDEE